MRIRVVHPEILVSAAKRARAYHKSAHKSVYLYLGYVKVLDALLLYYRRGRLPRGGHTELMKMVSISVAASTVPVTSGLPNVALFVTYIE